MSGQSFLRADDIIRPGPELDRLAAILDRVELPCLLAVIPLRSSPDLPEAIESVAGRARSSVWIVQHGTDHRNRSSGPRRDELGGLEPDEAHLRRLHAGRNQLIADFRSRFLDVYVPPWNTVTDTTQRLIRQVGFRSLSGWSACGDSLDVSLDVMVAYRPPRTGDTATLARGIATHRGGGIMLHPGLMTDSEADRVADVLWAGLNSGCLSPRSDEGFAVHVPHLDLSNPCTALRG